MLQWNTKVTAILADGRRSSRSRRILANFTWRALNFTW